MATLALIIPPGCGGDGGAADEFAKPAPVEVAAFREAFETERYDLLPALITDLETAAERQPEDAKVALTLALANLWGAAEIGRVGGDPAREANHAFAALEEFERARTLAPDDARIDGFIGAVQVRVGVAIGSADLVERGLAEIEGGIARHPEFNGFVKLLVLSPFPGDTEHFASAFDAIRLTMDACGLPVNEETPTLGGTRPPGDLSGPDRVCWNGPRALHNFEGTWLFVGDLYLKRNQPELARALYFNAKTLDSYATWDFQWLVDERIDRADELAARFADDDPSNDPQLIARSPVQCAVCHAR